MKTLNHIAIIMDGNGRWANDRGKHRTIGHIRGVRVAKKIITHAQNLGLSYLTLYAFSTENWKRPSHEVRLLMKLLFKYLSRERDNLVKKNIRFKVLGQLERLPPEIVTEITKTQEATSKNTGMVLNLALSYGGREDLLQATKKIAELATTGKISLNEISEKLFSEYLETSSMPDPDLIIRTSGEQRLSNFLLWQCAYTEFYFTPVYWPDFTAHDFNTAVDEYKKRQRRFGQTSDQVVTLHESNP